MSSRIDSVQRDGFRCTARASVTFEGRTETYDFELDVSDGSELAQKFATQGALGASRLARFREQLEERAKDGALHRACELHVRRMYTPELEAEELARRPKQARSAELDAVDRRVKELRADVEAAKQRERVR